MNRTAIMLGDHVRLGNGAYMIGTVVCVHPDGTVDVFRPYVHTSDFSYGDGKVIAYIGTETVTHLNPDRLELIEARRIQLK